jgi:hypothetical protein
MVRVPDRTTPDRTSSGSTDAPTDPKGRTIMDRRKAFATAGAVSVTALALVVALGANMGLFGLTRHDDGPGNFKLIDNTQQAKPSVRTEIVDVPVPAPAAPPAPVTGTGAPSGSSAPRPSYTPPASAGGGSYESPDSGHETEDGHESEPGDGADD